MNIMDIFNNEKNNENSLSNKIKVKTEMKKIERRIEDMASNVLDYISSEIDFINRGCSYSCPNPLSNNEKEELISKLKECVKALPEKLKSELDDIFACDKKKDEKEDSEDKEEDKPEVKEIKVELHPHHEEETPHFTFGY